MLQPKNEKTEKSGRTNIGKRFTLCCCIIMIITIIVVVEYLFLEEMQELITVIGIGVN